MDDTSGMILTGVNGADPITTVGTDRSSTIRWNRRTDTRNGAASRTPSVLRMPTLGELLASEFKERRYLLFPWLREQESCMVYAETGVGKSFFALSAALAIAGTGTFLGWQPEPRSDSDDGGYRVLYVDGEMHIGDIQERARMLLSAIPGIDRERAATNLRFLARQHQDPGSDFPLITDPAGMAFVMERVNAGPLDLVVLDNFSTLGEVEDENAAASFNSIQDFLLRLKTTGVATMLVHHAGKSGEDFRGSSKLAATFETIIKLQRPDGSDPRQGETRFRVMWRKVRAGGPKRAVREVIARLTTVPGDTFDAPERSHWEYEAADISRFDDMRERLENGEFKFQKEIADLYGVSRPMARKYLDRGIQLGLWAEIDLSRWFAKGEVLRRLGKRQAPIRPKENPFADDDAEETEDTAEF